MSMPGRHTAHVERTVLAWRRTGLALFVLALAAAKAADIGDAAVVAVVGVGVALGALALVLFAERRALNQQESSAWSLFATTTGLCVAVAGVGALLALAA
jgi:uncharacterized membrane protein YidH (DUF202 family)